MNARHLHIYIYIYINARNWWLRFPTKRKRCPWYRKKKRKEERKIWYRKKKVMSTSTERGFFFLLGVATCWWRTIRPSFREVEFTQPAPAWRVMFVIIFQMVPSGPSCIAPPPPPLSPEIQLYLCQVSTLYPLILNVLTHSTLLFSLKKSPTLSGGARKALGTTLKFVFSVTYYLELHMYNIVHICMCMFYEVKMSTFYNVQISNMTFCWQEGRTDK